MKNTVYRKMRTKIIINKTISKNIAKISKKKKKKKKRKKTKTLLTTFKSARADMSTVSDSFWSWQAAS